MVLSPLQVLDTEPRSSAREKVPSALKHKASFQLLEVTFLKGNVLNLVKASRFRAGDVVKVDECDLHSCKTCHLNKAMCSLSSCSLLFYSSWNFLTLPFPPPKKSHYLSIKLVLIKYLWSVFTKQKKFRQKLHKTHSEIL